MDFLDNIPQPLYKYRVWEEPCSDQQYSRRLVTHNEVYLASPDQFNDPFENSYPYKYKDEELTPENIFLKLIETGKKNWPDISETELHKRCFERQNSGVFEDGQYWKEVYQQFKDENNKIFGILSLTSKKDNLLMWSHYANSHTGFCVGLDKFLLWDIIQGSLGRAIYENEFPTIGLFDKTVGTLTKILSTKSFRWDYEDEYRFVKVRAARKIFNFPNEAVLEIILGHNMDEKYKEEIMKIASQKFPKAKIFQSQIDLTEFKLNMIPIIR